MAGLGHFETNSDACHCAYISLILLQELTFWLGKQGRRGRIVHLFTPRPPSSFSSGHRLEHVADLQAPVPRTTIGGRPSASLADKLTVEAKTLADLKVEKAAVEGERRKVYVGLVTVSGLCGTLKTASLSFVDCGAINQGAASF
jgi:hypothetical protein